MGEGEGVFRRRVRAGGAGDGGMDALRSFCVRLVFVRDMAVGIQFQVKLRALRAAGVPAGGGV
ncbi:hypothetical protein SDC9_129987 [bioreactor metagenome]|uniref:Uncharacterized protein n=1 Tax=bioreactor metagenome TaxID=1076179 RepID=A0A645D1C0_9ZZZZ